MFPFAWIILLIPFVLLESPPCHEKMEIINMDVTVAFDLRTLAFSTISCSHHVYATADGFYNRTSAMKLSFIKKEAHTMFKNLELIIDMKGLCIDTEQWPFAYIDYARAMELDIEFTSSVRWHNMHVMQ